MTTLEDAWRWYVAVKDGMNRLTRFSKHWDELPWSEDVPWVARLGRDYTLRDLTADEMAGDAALVRTQLDDLAVLVFFSVFESVVRDWIEEQVRPEVETLRHPALVRAGKDVLDAVAQGSFYKLLEPYKSPGTHAVVEQVNQVRRYRNWVAHGRRPLKKPDIEVTPMQARERLAEFLGVLRATGFAPASPTDDAA